MYATIQSDLPRLQAVHT